MVDLNRNRMIAALTYLIIAVFLASRFGSLRGRSWMRRAAIALYLAALAGVLALVGLWAAGFGD
jgi:hypothetical protein